jgi:hypothetical protein
MIEILLAVVLVVAVDLAACALLRVGKTTGPRAADVRTRLEADPEAGRHLVVRNPGTAVVVVGMTVRPRRGAWADRARPHLAVRPARFYERRRYDATATVVLGAVEAGTEQRWTLAVPPGPARVRVLVGQAGCRLRVHDHLIGPDHDLRRSLYAPEPCEWES